MGSFCGRSYGCFDVILIVYNYYLNKKNIANFALILADLMVDFGEMQAASLKTVVLGHGGEFVSAVGIQGFATGLKDVGQGAWIGRLARFMVGA